MASLLGGCVSFTPEPLSAQQALSAVRNRSLSDPALLADVERHLPDGAPRPPAWTFESLTWAAYRLNPGLAIERARLGVAQAGEIKAAESPNPSVTLPFGYTTNPKPGESAYTLGVGLDIPIETAGKRDARMAQARQASKAAQFEFSASAWQVRAHLRGALLDLRHGRRRAALLEAQAMRRLQIVQMLSRRVGFGDAARVALTQAQVDLAQLQRQYADAEQAAIQAQAVVAKVVGVPLATITHADIRLDSFDRDPPDIPKGEALDEALMNRADVQAALADYEASQAQLRLAVADQYPDIHLGPGYTFDAGAHKYALSLSGLELPLLNRHQGEIAEAAAMRQEAAARFRSVMTAAVAEVDRALADLQAAREQSRLAERQAHEQRRLAVAARQSFDTGATGRLDLALAELQADSAALDREDAFDRLQRAGAALEDAVQRPLPAEATLPRISDGP